MTAQLSLDLKRAESDSERLSPAAPTGTTPGSAEAHTGATYVCEATGRVYPFGGTGGAQQHYAEGEAVCEPCLRSQREQGRRRRRAAGIKPMNINTDIWSDCETTGKRHRGTGGHSLHLQRRDKPCGPCLAAKRAFEERKRRAAGAEPAKISSDIWSDCETTGKRHRGKGGYSRHLQRRDKPCEPCRAALRAVEERERRKAGIKPRSAAEGDPGTYRCDSGPFYREGTRAGGAYHRRRGEAVCPPCREAERAATRAFQQTDRGREKSRNEQRKRRELKRRAHIHWADEAEILAKTDGRCWLCGMGVDLDNRKADNGFHVDHVWPLNVGGLGWEPNLAAACGSCNKSKGDRVLDFRFIWIGLIPPPHLWLEDREWPDVPPRSDWRLDGRAAEVDQMLQRIGARERFTPLPAAMPAKWKAFRQAGIRPTGKMKRQFKAAITVKENDGPISG